VVIETTRFGQLNVGEDEIIEFPEGVFGFDSLRRFCLVDPGEDTLILWLQSMEKKEISFPVLEPRIFKTDYVVRLSGQELRSLRLDNINQSVVFNIITIPNDVTLMTANLKAPIVINLKDQLGKQVVLQENEYSVRLPIFKELKAHLLTIEATKAVSAMQTEAKKASIVPINVRQIVPSSLVKTL
jgi:flagellar assembly factor FliW